MGDQNLMQLLMIVILLVCGYLYLLQSVVSRAANRNALPVIAIAVLAVYALISIPMVIVISRMGSLDFVLISLLLLIACIGVFVLLNGLMKNYYELNKGILVLFILYILAVSYITIFSRPEGHSGQVLLDFNGLLDLFQNPSSAELRHFGLNTAMFVPIGILFPLIYPEKNAKIIYAILLGLVFTTLIEATQMILSLGQADIEDMVSNVLGTVIGMLLYKIYARFSG